MFKFRSVLIILLSIFTFSSLGWAEYCEGGDYYYDCKRCGFLWSKGYDYEVITEKYTVNNDCKTRVITITGHCGSC